MVQVMRKWAGCIADYVRFPFAKLNPHDKWNDQDKMEQLFYRNNVFNRIETLHLRFDQNFDCCLAR